MGGKKMAKNVGIWIDWRKAVIVSIDGNQEEVLCIDHEGASAESKRNARKTVNPSPPVSKRIPARAEPLPTPERLEFFGRLIPFIKDANYVLLFGPGDAKRELRKEIVKRPELGIRLAGIQPADEMTPEQVAIKVRRYFIAA
jgi:hypothetical protein